MKKFEALAMEDEKEERAHKGEDAADEKRKKKTRGKI
jgi:hypothetical protein